MRLKRRIKFIWGAGSVIKGRWYLGVLGVYDRVVGAPGDGLAISIRGVLLWLFGAAAVGYVGVATAVVLHLDRDPHNRVRLTDVLLIPVRWEHFQELRGQSLIDEGRSDFKGGRWSDAHYKLRLGLARSPGNLQARLLLAQLYLGSQQRPMARRILAEGLGDTFPGQVYLGLVFTLAGQAEDFALIDTVTAKYLPKLGGEQHSRVRRWLADTRIKNFFDLGQPARVLESNELKMDVSWVLWDELRVLALIALGRVNDALFELRIWRMRSSEDTDQVLRLLVRAEREAGHFEAMDRALAELVNRSPTQPAAYIYRTVQRLMAGRPELATAALEDFLQRFGAGLENLRLMAEPLAAVGRSGLPLLERVVAAAGEQGLETRPFRVLRAQALIAAGEPRLAKEALESISFAEPLSRGRGAVLANPLGSSPRQLAQLQDQRDWLRLVAEALLVPTPAAQSALLEALRKRPMTMQGLRPLVAALRTGGRLETAEAVLRWSEGPFPGNPWAAAQRREIAAAVANAADKTSEPAPAAPTGFGEKPFFARLDTLVAAKNWDDARKLLRDVRALRPEPAWLSPRTPELLVAQIRIEHGAGDRLAMLRDAKLYLDGDLKRAEAALALAQEFHDAGTKEDALLLLREVLKKSPEFAKASLRLSEWTAKKK